MRPGLRSLVAALALSTPPGPSLRAGEPPPPPPPAPAGSSASDDPAAAFFATEPVPTFRIEVSPEELERWKASPRAYVRAVLRDDERTYEAIAIKAKGGLGSWRELDDRPALTIDADRFHPSQRVHGLTKLHLNNSVQDETLLHEAIAAAFFEAAGIVAPRVAHARVLLGGRDLGLYVVKEGVDPSFLSRRFPGWSGNLYQGAVWVDVDGELERQERKGPGDRSDLAALVEACREPDLLARPARLEGRLDVDRFLTFVAGERMLGHWDGYAMSRNNYRLLVDPARKAVFLPHGLDQLLGDPEASVLDDPVGLVAAGVLEVPAWRKAYRARLASLMPLFDAKTRWIPFVRRACERLAPALARLGPEAVAAHAERVRELEERLVARERALEEQLRQPDPPGLAFDAKGRAAVVGFAPKTEDGEAQHDAVDRAGRRVLRIFAAGDGCVASWRRGVHLPAGRYTFTAGVLVKGVAPRTDERGSGAAIRISGAERGKGLSGSSTWTRLSFDFEVKEPLGHVVLVAELRAACGEVWFDAASLRLARR